jgi:predicted naringenin-chalcone synthase
VELCSLHFQYGWEPQQIVANALFADGAAALVGQAAQAADVSRISWRVAATGSCVFAGSQDAMTWTVGDYGFRMTLSPRVPELIRAHLADWLTHWLAQQGLSMRDIGSWAIHPGGPRVLSAVEAALNLPAGAAEASRQVLAEHGNMSSPTVLFILERLRRAGAPLPCVMLAFGPGLTAEAALLA